MIMVVPDAGKRCLTVLGAGASLGGEGRLVVVACPPLVRSESRPRFHSPVKSRAAKSLREYPPNGPRQLFAVSAP